jgi:hypothetical protein
MTDSTTSKAVLVILLGLPVLVGLALLWHGYALSVLWGWFVVPTFGAPSLTIPQAIGFAIVAGMFKAGIATTKHDHWWEGPLNIALLPALSLGFGWLLLWLTA